MTVETDNSNLKVALTRFDAKEKEVPIQRKSGRKENEGGRKENETYNYDTEALAQ